MTIEFYDKEGLGSVPALIRRVSPAGASDSSGAAVTPRHTARPIEEDP